MHEFASDVYLSNLHFEIVLSLLAFLKRRYMLSASKLLCQQPMVKNKAINPNTSSRNELMGVDLFCR